MAKICLACPANPTQAARDAIAALEAAIAEAERLVGTTMFAECTDAETRRDLPADYRLRYSTAVRISRTCSLTSCGLDVPGCAT